MNTKSGLKWAPLLLMWTLTTQAAELTSETIASFLPEAQPGYTMDSDAMEGERPDEGVWAGARYTGASTFVLRIHKGTPATANLLALVDQFAASAVDINGVPFMMLGGECFAALPGDVVVACSSFGEDVRRHLETIDFEALSAAAGGQ